jgi:DNA-directed RNA polymerase specialized sigma24 family protein
MPVPRSLGMEWWGFGRPTAPWVPTSAPLDRELDRLAALDEGRARIIEARFFGGLHVEETAEVLHVSGDTVKQDWRLAKRGLARELDGPFA